MADLLLKHQEGQSEALLQDMRDANRQSVRLHLTAACAQLLMLLPHCQSGK